MSATTYASATLTKAGFAPCTCRLGSGLTTRDEACDMLRAGLSAPMSITNTRGQTGYYWLCVLRDGERVAGYRLASDDQAGVMYDVDTDFVCDCVGHTRHGHCKHSRTVRSLKSRNLIP